MLSHLRETRHVGALLGRTNWSRKRARLGIAAIRPISNAVPDPEDDRGYYTPAPNELLVDRYRVVGKLGAGVFASVWVALDVQKQSHTAIKILNRLAMHELRAGILDEINLTKRVSTANPAHPGYKHVRGMTDHFLVKSKERNNVDGGFWEHACIAHEILGPSISDLITQTKGMHLCLPLPIVKSVAKQALLALDYLHGDCKMIHCDLKAANFLIDIPNAETAIRHALETSPDPFAMPIKIPIPVLDDPAHMQFKLMDFGHSNWINRHNSEWIQPEALRAPEVVLGAPWDTSADIWNLGCFLFEILTGRILFDDIANKPWTSADKTEDHIMRIRFILGEEIPDELMKYYHKPGTEDGGAGVFEGTMDHIATIFESLRTRTTTAYPGLKTHRWAPLPLFEKLLYSKTLIGKEYGVEEEDVKLFGQFIRKMLRVRPEERGSARELLGEGVLADVPSW